MRFRARSVFIILCAVVALAPLTSNTYAQSISIEWEITNRFRAFDYLGRNADDAAKLFKKYSITKSDGSVEAWQRRLAKSGISSPFAEKDGPWIENDKARGGSYDNRFLELPDNIQVRVSALGLLGKNCKWFLDDQELPISSKDQDNSGIDCAQVLTLNVKRSGSEIKVRTNDGREGSAQLEPRLRIIIGLGDSYASGQGNPDSPTKWAERADSIDWMDLGQAGIAALIKKPARWWSNRCNRSFWSYQNMVALAHASEDRKSIVSFVHLACSGAEVVDGILAPQRLSPGHPPACKAEWRDNISKDCDVARSQLRAMVDILCLTPVTPLSNAELAYYKSYIEVLRHDPLGYRRMVDLAKCPAGKARNVDAILLSIGGNDMGFARVIVWGLMSYEERKRYIKAIQYVSKFVMQEAAKGAGIICPVDLPDDRRCQGDTAIHRISELPKRYEILAESLKNSLGMSKSLPLYINLYPNPLYDEKGRLCRNPRNKNQPNEWSSSRLVIPPLVAPESWMINLTEWEAGKVDKDVIPLLNSTISEAAGQHGWVPVKQDDLMEGRGWCTGPNRQLLPPNRAVSWNPYAIDSRRIRTANDSFLTQWPGKLREDGSSGTFHPTADAHAASADRVLEAMRRGEGM